MWGPKQATDWTGWRTDMQNRHPSHQSVDGQDYRSMDQAAVNMVEVKTEVEEFTIARDKYDGIKMDEQSLITDNTADSNMIGGHTDISIQYFAPVQTDNGSFDGLGWMPTDFTGRMSTTGERTSHDDSVYVALIIILVGLLLAAAGAAMIYIRRRRRTGRHCISGNVDQLRALDYQVKRI